MFTTIKVGYLAKDCIKYDEELGEYIGDYLGHTLKLACTKLHSIDIVYDQAYRHLYFDYDCKVILSHHFYNFKDSDLLNRVSKGYKMMGFFK